MTNRKTIATLDILLEKTTAAGIPMESHMHLLEKTLRTAERKAMKIKTISTTRYAATARPDQNWSRMLILCAPLSKVIICISKAPQLNYSLPALAENWREGVLKREKKISHPDFESYRKIWVAIRYRNKKIERWIEIDGTNGTISASVHDKSMREEDEEE